MAVKYMERYSTLLMIREMQIEIKMIEHLLAIRSAKIKIFDITLCW